MLSAKFDRNIRIESKTKSTNSVGVPTYTYSFLKSKRASVDYGGGRMSVGEYAQRVQTDITFTIRFDSDVDYSCRIIFNNSIYRIEHIEVIGRNEGQRIRCSREQTDNKL